MYQLCGYFAMNLPRLKWKHSELLHLEGIPVHAFFSFFFFFFHKVNWMSHKNPLCLKIEVHCDGLGVEWEMTYVSKPQSYFISSYMYNYRFTCSWVILSVVNIQNHAVTFNNELMVPVNRIITLKAHNWSSPHFCFEHILIILDNYYSPERNHQTLMKWTFSTLWTHLPGVIPPSKTYSPKAFFFFFFSMSDSIVISKHPLALKGRQLSPPLLWNPLAAHLSAGQTLRQLEMTSLTPFLLLIN